MAEGDDGQEKTEEPTPKRKEEARKDGRVLTSNEVFVLTTLGSATLMAMSAKWALPGITGQWATGLVIDSTLSIDALILERMQSALKWVLIAGVGMGIPMIAVILISQAAMGGINFAPKALGFKPDKINPLAGIKRMVSMKALVDLSKAVLKVSLLLGIGALMLKPFMPALMGSSVISPGDSSVLLGSALNRVLLGLLLGLVIIGGIDLGWQMHSNNKALRMSRQDIKDEMKESEGSPEVKGQIRRRQMEASRRASERAALADVPQANAIITNPTHFAVALRYDPSESGAPVVLAMGKGPMAKEIIRRGRRAGVITLRVPPLARALYFTGAIGEQISEQLYGAVAVILAHVWRLEHGKPEPMPDVEVPTELQLDEHGRKIRKDR